MLVEKQLKPLGLKNNGNTCFFNSTIQALLSCSDFTNHFILKKFDESEKPVSSAFSNFLIEYKNRKSSNIAQSFICSIRNKVKLFNNMQQDAHEFLNTFLNCLFEENKKLMHFFAIKHEDAISCKRCGAVINVCFDFPMQYLFIGRDIESSLEFYESKEDLVDDSTQWKCESCNRKVPSGISHKIVKTSDYFIVHLNRFLDRYNKNKTPIEINRRLIIHGKNYDLLSAVCHIGDLRSGHYISYGKRNGKVYLFNDSILDESSFDGMDPKYPYILIYEKNKI